jgi:hypothetical protein
MLGCCVRRRSRVRRPVLPHASLLMCPARPRASLSQENAGGGPCMYAVAERLREWLQSHNEPAGSGSAYEEMQKRQKKAAEGDKGERRPCAQGETKAQ